MELNLTLPIQMLHFCVVWYLLKVLYFKPAIDFITQKNNEIDQLKQTIARLDSVIEQKKTTISSIWNSLKTFSRIQMVIPNEPQIDTIHTHINIDSLSSTNKEQIKITTEQLKKKIIEKAMHVEL